MTFPKKTSGICDYWCSCQKMFVIEWKYSKQDRQLLITWVLLSDRSAYLGQLKISTDETASEMSLKKSCVRYSKIKSNMYSVRHNCMFVLLFCYWLLVSASKRHHQANIYKKKKLKNAGAYSTKTSIFHGMPFTSINSLDHYYQPLDVPSVVSCVGILYCEYYEFYFQNYLIDWQPWNLKLLII